MNTEINNQPPSVCEQCLGDSKNIRMTKIPSAAECKICTFPFTLYHFRSSTNSANLTKTLICLRCSKQRNICQCCMLDLTWHIPVKVRDEIISIINSNTSGTIVTQEAKNDMMKRFLALRDVKLGGAQITSDPAKLEELMNKLKADLQDGINPIISAKKDGLTPYSEESRGNSKYFSVNISHILKKFPIKESFSENTENIQNKSFFIYNIDPSLPEWKISNKISNIVSDEKWKEDTSNSIVINHKAKCGGIRFKDEKHVIKFINKLSKDKLIVTASKGLKRGILQIDHYQLFVIPWDSGFSTGSFGNSIGENVKLSLSLDKLIRLEKQSSNNSNIELPQVKNVMNENNKVKKNPKKVTKKNSRRPKRASTLEL